MIYIKIYKIYNAFEVWVEPVQTLRGFGSESWSTIDLTQTQPVYIPNIISILYTSI